MQTVITVALSAFLVGAYLDWRTTAGWHVFGRIVSAAFGGMATAAGLAGVLLLIGAASSMVLN